MNSANMTVNTYNIAVQKFQRARTDTLLAILFTLVNVLLYFVSASYFMLFSFTAPYVAVVFGHQLLLAYDLTVIFGICIAAAVLIIGLYVLFWALSKKHPAFLIGVLVLFSLDCLFLLGFDLLYKDFSDILNLVLHVIILIYLISGVCQIGKLKNPPSVPETAQNDGETEAAGDHEPTVDSLPLRMADMTVRSRTLLEADACGHHVLYRRVKRVNELVINGKVYAECEMLMETAHKLEARVGGHVYTVGFDGAVHSYLLVDGQRILRKMRWY